MLWLLLSSFGDKKGLIERRLEDINVTEEEAASQRGQETWLRSQQQRASDLQFKSWCMWTQGCSKLPLEHMNNDNQEASWWATAVSLWTAAPTVSTKETWQRLPKAPKTGAHANPLTRMTVTRRTPDGDLLVIYGEKVLRGTSCPRLRLCKLTLPFFGRKRKQLLEACTGGVTPDVARVNFGVVYCKARASLMVHIVKNLPAMQETRVQSLGWEDPLEKG